MSGGLQKVAGMPNPNLTHRGGTSGAGAGRAAQARDRTAAGSDGYGDYATREPGTPARLIG